MYCWEFRGGGVNDGVIVSYNVYHCTIFDNGSDDGLCIYIYIYTHTVVYI